MTQWPSCWFISAARSGRAGARRDHPFNKVAFDGGKVNRTRSTSADKEKKPNR